MVTDTERELEREGRGDHHDGRGVSYRYFLVGAPEAPGPERAKRPDSPGGHEGRPRALRWLVQASAWVVTPEFLLWALIVIGVLGIIFHLESMTK